MGLTEVTSLGGRSCRLMLNNGLTARLIYFNVRNDFIYAKATKAVVTVEYFDSGTGWFKLDYDSSDSTLPEERRSFKGTAQVRLQNSGHLEDCHF